MITIHTALHRAFPLMALSGLLLAAWGLIVTPDEIKGNAQLWRGQTQATALAQSATDQTPTSYLPETSSWSP
jgi:hypothetical protein